MNFSIFLQIFSLKLFLLFSGFIVSQGIRAQKIDSIYIDLYTDSLKKGTYNYINIDGKLPNGKFIPLDTTELIFTSSDGQFTGNTLWIDPGFEKDKISIKATLKSNPSVYKEFTMFIKKKPDDEKLKTLDELLDKSTPTTKRARRRKS